MQNILQRNSKAPKKFWAELKKLMPGKKSKSNSPEKLSLCDNNGFSLESDLAMANYANDYFVKVGQNLANTLPTNS